MRSSTSPRPMTLTRYVRQAEKLAESKPDGKLPHVTWLRRNGHINLEMYIRAHPREFKHIKQNKRSQRSHDETARQRQVALAWKLAKKNKGRLLSVSRLMQMKRTGLLSYINKHPEFFDGMLQDREHKSAEEHVCEAEKLARKNGGVLPGGGKISQAGWDLYKFMKRNPEHFVHIPGAAAFFNNARNQHASGNGRKTNGTTKTLSARSKNRRQKRRKSA